MQLQEQRQYADNPVKHEDVIFISNLDAIIANTSVDKAQTMNETRPQTGA